MGDAGSSCGGGSGTSEVVFKAGLKYCGPPCALGDTTGVSLEGEVTLEPSIEGLEGTRLLLFLGMCNGGANGLSSGAATIAILPLDPFHSGLLPPNLLPSFNFRTRSLNDVWTLGAVCAVLYASSRFVTTGVNCPGCTDGGRPRSLGSPVRSSHRVPLVFLRAAAACSSLRARWPAVVACAWFRRFSRRAIGMLLSCFDDGLTACAGGAGGISLGRVL